MRAGYSMTEGELLSAEEADYGDCSKYQIVCPSCREAVFKGMRLNPKTDRPTHYFSHYHSDAEEAALCELRVASLAKSFLTATTIEGRGQHLADFMRVFREGLIAAQAEIGIPAGEFKMRVSRLLARPYLDRYVPLLNLYERHMIGRETERDKAAETILKMPAFQGRSPFWARRQASFVLDMMRHLQTPQARPSRRFLVASAFVAASNYQSVFGDTTWLTEAAAPHIQNLMHSVGKARNPGVVARVEDIWYQNSKMKQEYDKGADDAKQATLEEMAAIPEPLRKDWAHKQLASYDYGLQRLDALKVEIVCLELIVALHNTILGLIAAIPFVSSGKATLAIRETTMTSDFAAVARDAFGTGSM